MKKIINSIILLLVEIIGPYIMAYGSTIINAQINDMSFDLGNGKYIFSFVIMLLNPLIFLGMDVMAVYLLYKNNIWKYTVTSVCVLNLVMMPLIWTPIVPNALTLKMMHTQHSGFISMFLLNNFILLWLSFSALRKTKKIEESLKELG